jgi:hypothetical protein
MCEYSTPVPPHRCKSARSLLNGAKTGTQDPKVGVRAQAEREVRGGARGVVVEARDGVAGVEVLRERVAREP